MSRQALLTLRRQARGKLSTALGTPSGVAAAEFQPLRGGPASGSSLRDRSTAAPASGIHSLHDGDASDPTTASLEAGQVSFFRRFFLRLGGFYSPESTRMRAALRLQRAILEQADDNRLVQGLQLPPSDFPSRFALASLHLWLTLVRLRAEGDDGKLLGQELYDHFWAEMENRVRAEGVVVRLSKWMKELESTFYGSCTAYDAALAPGAPEGELAGALRRNVLMTHAGGAEAAALARYVRHQLACLAVTDSTAVMAGQISYMRARAPQYSSSTTDPQAEANEK